jgi:hypothetical protein
MNMSVIRLLTNKRGLILLIYAIFFMGHIITKEDSSDSSVFEPMIGIFYLLHFIFFQFALRSLAFNQSIRRLSTWSIVAWLLFFVIIIALGLLVYTGYLSSYTNSITYYQVVTLIIIVPFFLIYMLPTILLLKLEQHLHNRYISTHRAIFTFFWFFCFPFFGWWVLHKSLEKLWLPNQHQDEESTDNEENDTEIT